MITGLLHLHSTLRWAILIILIVAIVKHFSGKSNGASYSASDKRMALIALILCHLQVVIGFVLYFSRGWSNFGEDTMKNAIQRFWSVEHMAGMLIAVVLITIGYSKAKRAVEDRAKFGKIATFYLIGLILILASIPWPFRSGFENIGWI